MNVEYALNFLPFQGSTSHNGRDKHHANELDKSKISTSGILWCTKHLVSMGLDGEFQQQSYPFLVQGVVECDNQISKLTSIYYHLL